MPCNTWYPFQNELLLKPALAYLREQGFASTYIDDLLLLMNHIKPASEQRLKL